jgi:DnaJ-class molecular chaperone
MIQHQISVTKGDGTPYTHTATLLDITHASDGCIAVLATCCGKVGAAVNCPKCGGSGTLQGGVACHVCQGSGKTKDLDLRSWHTYYDSGMPVVIDGVAKVRTNDDHVAEITAHVQRVAERHVARDKADELLASLLPQPAPAAVPPDPVLQRPGSG